MPDPQTTSRAVPVASTLESIDRRLGYCTNVHAGHDLESTLANLGTHSTAVRAHLGMTGVLDIGLWLSADAARDALPRIGELRQRLAEMRLRVFTINGFPYGNFHEPVVKHHVYEPNWADPRRLQYTLDLVRVLAGLLNEGEEGSISTLPIGWPEWPAGVVDRAAAAEHLVHAAHFMAKLRAQTGTLIHLDLEPEPGCILSTSDDAVRFWHKHFLTRSNADRAVLDPHVRVCHDICHAAVMFESQRDVFERYHTAGIRVGKVQISSAIKAVVGAQDTSHAAVDSLCTFVEPRYLHQTCVRRPADGVGNDTIRFHEDLPLALGAMPAAHAAWEARVHFHVPIFMESIGALGTTRDEIEPCLRLALAAGVHHFEVETYAWSVLPRGKEEPPIDLSSGIAEEMRYAAALMQNVLC